MPGFAASINFASGDAGDPKPRPLCAPDWAVSIPHMGRSAGESLASGNDRNLQDHVKQGTNHAQTYLVSWTLGQVRSLLCRRNELSIPHILGT